LEKKELMVVGIGASAGGLEALTALIQNLPVKNNTAYIIAQHLSPAHKTMLINLLSRDTKLTVKDAVHHEELESDIIYITPPNKNIEVNHDNRMILKTPEKHSILPKPSVNQLFISLAETQKENAIGIILSGTGSDGTQGMRAINAEGGITIVQEPESAKYDGMPRSAIDGSSVDIVIKPAQIGSELVALSNFPRQKVLKKYQASIPNDEISLIYEYLFQHAKVDFSLYKKTTIGRRIERRMVALKATSLKEYVQHLINNKNEVESLFKDILIGVTSFFRDKEAFDSLKKEIYRYLKDNINLEELRIWIPGTSTGEEAYSVLFCILEVLNEMGLSLHVRIFATDVDEDALKIARRAIYTEASLSEMSESRVKKYFTISSGEFEVKKQFREHIVFSKHNLLADPPFKNIDLVVCRNLLIYFNLEAQKQVMPFLHYSLNNNGILFLGKSENITGYEHMFAPIDKQNKIFKHIQTTRKDYLLNMFTPRDNKKELLLKKEPTNEQPPLHEIVINEASKVLLPNIVVVNEQMEVLYKKGEMEFLTIPEGYVSYNLFKMVDPKLAIDLRAIINFAKSENKMQTTSLLPITIKDKEVKFLKVFLVPLLKRRNPLYIFFFLVVDSKELPTLSPEELRGEEALSTNKILEMELARTKEHMQILIEELETSNEELQSTNEELQSSNEELQSTNEELETSNEELQSTNEELQTAYAELKEIYQNNNSIKDSFKDLNSQYEHILDNINDIVIVSDTHGLFLRVNKATERVTGYTKEQLLTKSWQSLSEENGSLDFDNIRKRLFRNDKNVSLELKIISLDDEVKTISTESYLFEKNGETRIWTFASDITAVKHYQEELAKSEKKHKIILEKASIGIAHITLNGRFLSVNNYISNFLGYSTEELLTKTSHELTYHDDLDIFVKALQKLINGTQSTYKLEKRYIKKDNSIVWAKTSVTLIRDANGEPEYFISVIEDIDTLKILHEKAKIAKTVFDTTQEGIVITDNNLSIISVNQAFEEISGYSFDEIIGKPATILKSLKHSDEFYTEIKTSLKNSGMWSGEVINRTKDKALYPAFLNINASRDDKNEIIEYVGIINDISAIKSSQDKIKHLANHDQLTNLPNRAKFDEEIVFSIDEAKRNGEFLALLFIDLDGFKAINDNYGHKAGDYTLIKVADRLIKSVNANDLVSRFGGDEFVILLKNLHDSAIAGKIAQKILDVVSQPIEFENYLLRVGSSIGISIYPNDGLSPEELKKQADTAMYIVKENGKNAYQFASEGQDSIKVFEKLALKQSFLDGIQTQQFEVFYQPVIDKKGEVRYFEALVRWKHPTLGMISPSKFIPLAEESEIINYLTDFVLYKAIDDIGKLRIKTHSNCFVSINTTIRNFESDAFYNKLKKYILRNSIDVNCIVFEMSEKDYLISKNNKNDLLARYETLGVKFAIDNFGSKNSNLSCINSSKLHYVKFQHTIVSKIGQNKKTEKLIQALSSIAKIFNFYSVAEGVEEQSQLDFLVEHGIDFFQGYFIGEPQPIEKMKVLLKKDFQAKLNL
jgi:two-component system CheB/CheR fusion protein